MKKIGLTLAAAAATVFVAGCATQGTDSGNNACGGAQPVAATAVQPVASCKNTASCKHVKKHHVAKKTKVSTETKTESKTETN